MATCYQEFQRQLKGNGDSAWYCNINKQNVVKINSVKVLCKVNK